MGFLLDTVTVSEMRKGNRVDARVRAWQQAEPGRPGHLSVITLNEIRFGIRRLEGRDAHFSKLLLAWYETLLDRPTAFPLLSVTLQIAEVAADFRAAHGLSFNDSLIAATAKCHGLTLATRNISDFEKTGIHLINPWESEK
ncbi:MAG: type II toxin-antitoxin system VapC family toxin [Luteolibacter sp.]